MAKAVKQNNFILVLVAALITLVVLGLVIKVVNQGVLNTNSATVIGKDTEVKKLVSFVDEAASLVQSKGLAAFDEMRVEGSVWRYGDTYVFAYDLSGNTLFLPPQQNVEGTNRWNTQDPKGTYYVREMITQLKSKDSGWLSYYYQKPGTTEPVLKLAYFKKAKLGNKQILVGSGVYAE